MHAEKLPASTGWQWVRDGMALFRRQPIAMFTWALTIGFLVLVASILAPIGPLLFVALMPAVTVMTLEAGRSIEQDQVVFPLRLFAVLKTPGLAKQLITMGAIYVVAVLIAGLLSFLPFADTMGEALEGITNDDMTPLLLAMRTPLIIFAVFYVAIAALFWYAPILVAWHQVDLRKALFFSWIACWRNKGAFLVYGASWLIVILALEAVSGLLVAVGLSENVAGMVQMPLNFLAAAVLYCSFYPSYTSVFGPAPSGALLPRT